MRKFEDLGQLVDRTGHPGMNGWLVVSACRVKACRRLGGVEGFRGSSSVLRAGLAKGPTLLSEPVSLIGTSSSENAGDESFSNRIVEIIEIAKSSGEFGHLLLDCCQARDDPLLLFETW